MPGMPVSVLLVLVGTAMGIAKRAKYHSDDLIPFAIETGGRLGSDARAFVKHLAGHAECPTTEVLYLYRALSVTLQDGVARQLLQT